MKNGQILVLNEKEVCSVLDMPTAITDVETALKEYAEGLCVNPVKLHLSLRPEIEGYLNSMPAYLKAHDVMGVKLVSVYKYNMKEHHAPVTMGTIVLPRPETAMPFAVLDGTYVTAIRTGAAAGVGLALLLPEQVLKKGFGAFLCALSLVLWRGAKRRKPGAKGAYTEQKKEGSGHESDL